MAELTKGKLIEKMVRATVKLEGIKLLHKDTCPLSFRDVESDDECNCGAREIKNTIQETIKDLSID